MSVTAPASFDVFLSHSQADHAAVEAIARRLREEAGLNPFLDIWHLIPGVPWQEAIEQALGQSNTVAVFVGPTGVSPWHNEELRAALDRAVRHRDDYRVMPVLLPGADAASLKGFLARRVWIDFRSGVDAPEALARLCAGIKGEAPGVGAYELPDEPAPYRSLFPFQSEHSRFFFGRDEERKRLLELVASHPFVGVVGSSGCGKSSLVQAGLLPDLRAGALQGSERWRILPLTPGSQPLLSLASKLAIFVPVEDRPRTATNLRSDLAGRPDALRSTLAAYLADDPTTVLLFVDQFEEIFTLGARESEQGRREIEQLVALLYDAAARSNGQVRCVISLRSDFVDACLAVPRLPLLLEHQLPLGRVDDANLRQVIVKPAQMVGAFLEKGLVSMVLRDVEAQPGGLPLLEDALFELWRARRGAWLTTDAYEHSGGVSAALERRADRIYSCLSDSQKLLARNIFLRLTGPAGSASDTRRRVAREELYPVGVERGQVDEVIDALAGPNARLIVADGECVEVAHEVLLRRWGTLRGWLAEDQGAIKVHQRLTAASQEWQSRQDPSDLYRGRRLDEAERWAATHGAGMNQLEQDFLTASVKQRATQQRRWIIALVAASVVLLALLVVSGWLGVQADVRGKAAATAAAGEADQRAPRLRSARSWRRARPQPSPTLPCRLRPRAP